MSAPYSTEPPAASSRGEKILRMVLVHGIFYGRRMPVFAREVGVNRFRSRTMFFPPGGGTSRQPQIVGAGTADHQIEEGDA